MSPSRYPSLPVLIVDDETHALKSLEIALCSSGINNIVTCKNSQEVMALFSQQDMEVVLLDLWMPHVSGEELLTTFTGDFPDIPVIIITGLDEVEMAVRCMKTGAFDYLVKPVEKGRLITSVTRAIELRELQRENRMLRNGILADRLENPGAFSEIITNNALMISIFHYVEAIARTSQPVLVTGETGAGKELIARSIHSLSNRVGDFIPVDVASLDDNLFADTLFGHKRGAFTDASEARSGLVEKAAAGTLFLDEIGDLSHHSQLKLLRLLQDREYFPIGSDMLKRTDTRIIVSTNLDIHSQVHSGKFRKDLYYRLRTHHVHIPPLRERRDDLPLLLEHFLGESSRRLGKKMPTFPGELIALLNAYDFPGNIRELKALIYDAVSIHKSGILSMESFKISMGLSHSQVSISGEKPGEKENRPIPFPDPLPTLKEIEHLLISEALDRSKGNQSICARLLGISRQALNRRLKTTLRYR